MSFLDWPIEHCQSGGRAGDTRRRKSASHLISLFARAFPQITYRLIWDSPLINAQAWRLGKGRNVYLYGGLVRHPVITRAGLAVALAHETGHHLGGQPRDPDMTWMSWQGQADYWAAHVGMPAVFGDSARTLTLRGARQIGNLERQLAGDMDEWASDLSPAVRLKIFSAGLRGEAMPTCAIDEFKKLSSSRLGVKTWAL
jgi:hypothetical protein